MICPYCNWRCPDGHIKELEKHEKEKHKLKK